MLFPAGTDRGFRRTPYVTMAIITACIAMFFVQMVAANKAQQERGGDAPLMSAAHASPMVEKMVSGRHTPFYTHITSAFLHADWLHIAGNMIFLAIFGSLIEDRLGHWGFALLYLCGAIASSYVFGWLQEGVGLGASGAVATVTGAFLALMPLVQVRVVSIIGGSVVVTGWFFVILAVGFDLFLASRIMESNIGYGAHLGGYAFGFTVAMLLLVTRILPPERHDMFALFKRARLRRELRAAGAMQGERVRVKANEPSDPALADIAQRRTAIAHEMTKGDLAQAGLLYARMVDAHPTAPAASVLSRRHQIDLANHLFSSGQPRLAAIAYERFAQIYRDERDAPRARLMLALIAARKLGDRDRARTALAGLKETLRDESERGLCEELMVEVGEQSAMRSQA